MICHCIGSLGRDCFQQSCFLEVICRATLAGFSGRGCLRSKKRAMVTRVLPPVQHRRNPRTRALDSSAAGAPLGQRRQRSPRRFSLRHLGDFEGIAAVRADRQHTRGLSRPMRATRLPRPRKHAAPRIKPKAVRVAARLLRHGSSEAPT
jgi:hypothetical protein